MRGSGRRPGRQPVDRPPWRQGPGHSAGRSGSGGGSPTRARRCGCSRSSAGPPTRRSRPPRAGPVAPPSGPRAARCQPRSRECRAGSSGRPPALPQGPRPGGAHAGPGRSSWHRGGRSRRRMSHQPAITSSSGAQPAGSVANVSKLTLLPEGGQAGAGLGRGVATIPALGAGAAGVGVAITAAGLSTWPIDGAVLGCDTTPQPDARTRAPTMTPSRRTRCISDLRFRLPAR